MSLYGGDSIKYKCKCGRSMLMKEPECPCCHSPNYPLSGEDGLTRRLFRQWDVESLRERVEELEQENEKLKAEAKLGNIPYKEAIRLREENEKLRAEVGRLKQ